MWLQTLFCYTVVLMTGNNWSLFYWEWWGGKGKDNAALWIWYLVSTATHIKLRRGLQVVDFKQRWRDR